MEPHRRACDYDHTVRIGFQEAAEPGESGLLVWSGQVVQPVQQYQGLPHGQAVVDVTWGGEGGQAAQIALHGLYQRFSGVQPAL